MGLNGNPYDQSPPIRPSIADFNGAQKIQDPNAPPANPNTDPLASEYNELCSTTVAFGQVTLLARVSVNGGASPTITKVVSPVSSVNGNLSAFILTRNAAGDVWVECATNTTLPPFLSDPTASVVTLTTGGASAQYGTGPNSHPAARVQTFTNALTDLNFVVSFY